MQQAQVNLKQQQINQQQQQYLEEEVFQLVQQLAVPSLRENALLELSKRRESLEDLAPILWHPFKKITIYYITVVQQLVAVV